jgi:aspartate/methionine/tyrosine aminotransferase
MRYSDLDKAALLAEFDRVKTDYETLRGNKLNLNLTRGKPETAQLALSDEMFHSLDDGNFVCDGIDARNYGELAGLPACRKLFAEILACKPEEVILGNNASLNLMYDLIAKAYTHGLLRSVRPWAKEETIKFLCPFPGYDRHFNVSKSFGMQLIPVPLGKDGPDMDLVEELVKDPPLRACGACRNIPIRTVTSTRFPPASASPALKPAAPDFALMWDNAYCIHGFCWRRTVVSGYRRPLPRSGNPDLVYEFASTSKVTFAGAGVSCMASSVDNIKYMLSLMTFQTIGPNKINELMHVRFLKNREHTLAHMKKHAAIMKPKFDLVCDAPGERDRSSRRRKLAPSHGRLLCQYKRYARHGEARRCALQGRWRRALTGAGATYPAAWTRRIRTCASRHPIPRCPK